MGILEISLVLGILWLIVGWPSWKRYLMTTRDSRRTRESVGALLAFLIAWPAGWLAEPDMFKKDSGLLYRFRNYVRKVRKEDD